MCDPIPVVPRSQEGEAGEKAAVVRPLVKEPMHRICTLTECDSLRVWKWTQAGQTGWSWGCDAETDYPFASRDDALIAALAAHSHKQVEVPTLRGWACPCGRSSAHLVGPIAVTLGTVVTCKVCGVATVLAGPTEAGHAARGGTSDG